MKCDNYGNRDIQIQYLKKMYKKYTNHIINMEYHIDKLHSDWVLDTDTRNNLMHKLDLLVRKMMTIYNNNLKLSYKELDNNESEKFPDGVVIDTLDIIDLIGGIQANILDPFYEIKNKLFDIGKFNGFLNMEEFFKLYVNDSYIYLLDQADIEIFDLYNKVFVPIGVSISDFKSDKSDSHSFNISKYRSKCDSLIDNTCKISIILKITPQTKITMDGYIRADVLNTFFEHPSYVPNIYFISNPESEQYLQKNRVDSSFALDMPKLCQ